MTRSFVCAVSVLLFASPFAWATNTYNSKCPADASVGTVGTPPLGWSNGPGIDVPNAGAYMAGSSQEGCTYPLLSTLTGTLTKVVSGITCTPAGDNQTFNCSDGSHPACPATATTAYTALPAYWTGSGTGQNSAGTGTIAQNSVNGNTLTCTYKGGPGALFQATPVGSTCTTGADHLSHDCTTPFVQSDGVTPVPDVTTVLDSSTMTWLSDSIVFTKADGTDYPYSDWNATDKSRFKTLYQDMLSGSPLNLLCPDHTQAYFNTYFMNDALYYSATQALDMYMGQVAHMFYIEATQKVSWSFLGFSTEMQGIMLGSTELFSPIVSGSANSYPPNITPGVSFQSPFRTETEFAPSYVCDPDVGYRFMIGTDPITQVKYTKLGQDLIGPDRVTTLKNLTLWFADNVDHSWVAGPAATSSLLEDRLSNHNSNGKGVLENTGCHGGSNMFFDIARSVNLPIVVGSTIENSLTDPSPRPVGNNDDFVGITHAGLVFAWGEPGSELVLQHMDDVNANVLQVWNAVDQNGVRIPDNQMAQIFFNAMWRPSTDLTAREFQYGDLAPVTAGTGYGTYKRLYGEEDRSDFGRLLGAWPADYPGVSTYFNAYFEYDLGYTLCPWSYYLTSFCTDPQGFNNFAAPPPLGDFHTLADQTARATACLEQWDGNAADGCALAPSYYNAFFSDVFGQDWWIGP